DSTGTVLFASPLPDSVPGGNPAVAYAMIPGGQYKADVFVNDTLARTSTVTVTAAGFDAVSATYTVRPNQPARLDFITPVRRLVAGTTVEYTVTGNGGTPLDPSDDVRVEVPTPIMLSLRDAYGNITSTDVNTHCFFDSASSIRVGRDPSRPLVIGPDWTQLDLVSNKQFDINANETEMTLYAWDTKAGTGTLNVSALVGDTGLFPLADNSQDVVITPARAAYFSIHHNFTSATPLKVTDDTRSLAASRSENGAAVTWGVNARDRFGNVARGDPSNGQYYTGKIVFSVNSTSASLVNRENSAHNTAGTTYYVFSPESDPDPGVYPLLGVRADLMTAGLKINVTDYATAGLPDSDPAKIFGYTGDAGRPWPTAQWGAYPPAPGSDSDADVVVGGVVIQPTDMAPDPSTEKQNLLAGTIFSGMKELFQGSGVIDPPYPVLMWKLSARALPIGSGFNARLKEFKVLKTGDLPASDVKSLELYADSTGNGNFCPPEAAVLGNCTSPDVLVASATFADWAGTYWVLGDLDVNHPDESLIVEGSRDYYFAVRISTAADLEVERSLGLGLQAPNQHVIVSPVATPIAVAVNNFAMFTATSAVKRAPAQMYTLSGSTRVNIAAYVDGVQTPTVMQGQKYAGMLRVPVWTNEFEAVLDYITVNRISEGGSEGSDGDITAVRLFMDTNPKGCENHAGGNGTFESGNDTEVTDPNNPAVFSGGSVRLNIVDRVSCGAVDPSTRTYYVVFDYSNSAVLDKTHAAIINSGNIFPVPGTGKPPAFTLMQSSFVTVVPTFDTARITSRFNMATDAKVQGSTDVAVTQLTFQTNQGAAVVTGLKLDRWSHSSQGGVKNNKVSDVANVKVYHDINGNALLEPGTDQLVTPDGEIQRFPWSSLTSGLPIGATEYLEVADFQPFKGIAAEKPAEEPYLPPIAPGRLVLGDDQTNENLKEVVYYEGYDEGLGRFTGLTRGADGTAELDWSSGAVVSGQARVRLRGSATEVSRGLPGTELTIAEKKYIIAYDLDALAAAGSQVRLGFEMRSTDYFKVEWPDLFNPLNVGIEPNLTNGNIQTILEYPDQVYISPESVNASLELMQGTTGNTLVSFAMSVEKSDARWRRLIVRATGTAVGDGLVTDDCYGVSLYRDVNANYKLDAADLFVASAAFNTGGAFNLAKIEFGQSTATVQRVLAQPSRYLLAADMNDNAVPTDPVTNQPRTFGLILETQSFPMVADGNDDPVADSISETALANKRPEPFLFVSALHNIVPKPQTLTVAAFPVFSDKAGVMYPAPRLTMEISTLDDDPLWPVSSTLGLPSSGYALLDNEIISYDSLLPGEPGALLNIVRGRLGSLPVVHSSGTVIGPEIRQGSKYRSAFLMHLSASDFEIQVDSIRLRRLSLDPLNGADGDVARIRIFRDMNGDGVLNLDSAGEPTADLQVSSGVFAGSLSDLRFSEEGRDYVLVKRLESPATFFVTLDMDPTALFSHPAVENLNQITGIELDGQSPFSVVTGPSGVGHTVEVTTPVASPGFVIVPTTDTLSIAVANAALGSALQNSKNVPMLRLEFRTKSTDNTAVLEALRLDLRGTGVDSDIVSVKIWKDPGNDGVANDTGSVEGVYPNLLTAGNDFFNQRTTLVRLNEGLVISSVPTVLYVTADISEFGQVGKTLGLSIDSTDYFTVAVPDGKQAGGVFPAVSALTVITEAASVVTMGVNDIAGSAGSVVQGQTNVPVLRFNMKTDTSQSVWRKLMVEKTGYSVDVLKPSGRNRDVKFVRVYRDVNANDTLDLADTAISSPKTVTAVAISTDAAMPFDLVVASTQNFPASGEIIVAGLELMRYASISTSAASLRIVERSMVLGVSSSPLLAVSSGVTVEKVDFFDQVDDNNRVRLVELSLPQLLSPSQQTYFLTYDIGDAAVVGNGVGAKIPAANAIVIDAPPDSVSGMVNVGVSQFPQLPNGTTSQQLPFETGKVLVGGTILKISGLTMAPETVEPGARSVTFLRLDLRTDQGSVDLGALRLTQTGDARCESAEVCDLVSMSLFLDSDANQIYSAGDERIGFSSHVFLAGAGSGFENGVATVSITSGGLPR
ncbi:MAG TPA: hypothetical protein PK523_03635, partial [Elusimicrobiales bacterium]|nr:hypothetical protein [Elusimicrobiales bacterium]